jgi:hypothetical protein
MNFKPDKECEKRDDIALLSEIVTNSMYWQDTFTPAAPCTHLFNYYNVVLFSKFLTKRLVLAKLLMKPGIMF